MSLADMRPVPTPRREPQPRIPHHRSHLPRLVRSWRLQEGDYGFHAYFKDTPLSEAVHMLVPLRMAELRHLDDEELSDLANEQVEDIAAHGDDAQYGGKHGRAGRSAIVTGIAAAALAAPGGISIMNGHWCAEPPCALCPERDGSEAARLGWECPERCGLGWDAHQRVAVIP